MLDRLRRHRLHDAVQRGTRESVEQRLGCGRDRAYVDLVGCVDLPAAAELAPAALDAAHRFLPSFSFAP
jgi:hypothetical protein